MTGIPARSDTTPIVGRLFNFEELLHDTD